MAEEKAIVQEIIPNIGVTDEVTTLAGVINETYSYANSTLFIAEIAGYYRDYAFRYVRPSCQWLDGYVPSLHNRGTGIISTRIASKLVSGLAKQLAGEKLVFRLKDDPTDPHHKEALKKVSNWSNKQNIHKAVKNGIGFACANGTCLVKTNVRLNGELWWEPVRFDNCFYLASFTGEIKEATFLIRGYTDTREGKNNCQYFLCEKRYWKQFEPKIKKNPDGTYTTVQKKEIKPVVEYKVHRATSQSLNNLMASSTNRSSVGWEEIPYEIRKCIKNDYGVLRIDEPKPLPFANSLGVVAFINGEGDISVPTGANFGESMIVGIQDDLITYELATSYQLRDMQNGKGTVYLPKSMSLGDVAPNVALPLVDSEKGALGTNGVPYIPPHDDNLYKTAPNTVETLKGVSPEEQQAIVQQFELRGDQWQMIKENALKNIAVKWGMSPKILASFLATGTAQMTATQIDSEDDISIAFINLHRSYFINAINELLELALNYMGYETNIEVKFASPSLINKDRLLNRIAQELSLGLIDLEDAIREMNPDLDEESLQTKIEKALQQQQMNMLTGMTEMDDVEGGFPEADAMKGSTIPRV